LNHHLRIVLFDYRIHSGRKLSTISHLSSSVHSWFEHPRAAILLFADLKSQI
jgi:hypothetical protein